MPDIRNARAACTRRFSRPPAIDGSRNARTGVLLVIGLLVLGSLALWFDVFRSPVRSDSSIAVDVATPLMALGNTSRYATLWPFARDSIWNLPIGAGARYVPANITKARAWGMTVDQDVLILTPGAPRTKFFYNDDAWNGGSRCNPEGGTLFEAPIPKDFVVPPARPGWTPNFATAILAGDNRTLIQGQPMARCSAGGNATMWWSQTQENLYGTGFSGGHGGSMLSSIGGTIRSGELVPSGAIRHAMKVNLDGWDNLWWDNKTRGFRWPALAADSCASSCYRGKNPALRMGSLLALPASVDLAAMGLETEPAKIVAHAFQEYGGYVVDNTGWSVYALSTEFSPQHGWLEDEFERVWGFPIDPPGRDNPWARDMDRIFLALHVVDNWDAAAWATVRASNGTLGAGGGRPRVSWAPDFGGTIPPPDLTPPETRATLSGTPGPANWFLSAVTVSLTATDDSSGVASIHIRVDKGPWSNYYSPKTVSGEGRHSVEFYTTDIAGNDGLVQAIEFGIDASAPRTTAVLTGTLGGDGWYRSPVTVALSATDGGAGVASIEARVDGGAWGPYTAPIGISVDGRHTVEYRATDAIGNAETASSVGFLIDTQAFPIAPAVEGTLGSAGWYRSSVTVSLAPVGERGSLAWIAYSVDSAWGTYSQPFVVGDGRHVVSYQAHYALGNVGTLESITINVDGTAPTVAVSAETAVIPPDGAISWTGSDAGSGLVGYEVSLDGGPFVAVGSATQASGPWRTGTHVLAVRAFDAAGNNATAEFPFRVDLNAPRVNPKVPAVGSHSADDLIRVLLVIGTVCAIVALLLRIALGREHLPQVAPQPPAPPSDLAAKPSGGANKAANDQAVAPGTPGPASEPNKAPEEPLQGDVAASPTELATEPAAEPPTQPPVEPESRDPGATAERAPEESPKADAESPPEQGPENGPSAEAGAPSETGGDVPTEPATEPAVEPPTEPPTESPKGEETSQEPRATPNPAKEESPQAGAASPPEPKHENGLSAEAGAPAETPADTPTLSAPAYPSIEYLMEVPFESPTTS